MKLVGLKAEIDTLSFDMQLKRLGGTSYTPRIRDLERTFAVRHGYYDYTDPIVGNLPQSKRLGPQLLVRAFSPSVPYNPEGLSEEPFIEFWLEPIDGIPPSPALQAIRDFLNANEHNDLPIPEPMLVAAKLENPNAPIRRYREWMPREITKDDAGLDVLRDCFKLIHQIPRVVEELTEVLEQALIQVENSFARMTPTRPSEIHIATSEAIAADPAKLTGISSTQTTSATRPNPTAG